VDQSVLDLDQRLRLAAPAYLAEQTQLHGEVLPRMILATGFTFDGSRVALISPQQGIFKPAIYGTLLLSLPCVLRLLHQKRVPSGVGGPAALGSLDDGGRPDPEPVPQCHARIPVALDGQVRNALASARDACAPVPLPEGG
jgi:hypothetical protein